MCLKEESRLDPCLLGPSRKGLPDERMQVEKGKIRDVYGKQGTSTEALNQTDS